MGRAFRYLVALVLVGAALTVGGLLVTSTAILYHKELTKPGWYTCYYFTGTRTITTESYWSYGCEWFLAVSASPHAG